MGFGMLVETTPNQEIRILQALLAQTITSLQEVKGKY